MLFLQGICRCSLCLVQLHSALSHAVPLELRRSPSSSPSRRSTPLPGLLAHVGLQLASLPIASCVDLLQHLRLVADSCQAGAGSQATLSSVLRLKHIRRWLLAHIRQCSGADFDSLQHDLAARCPADTPDGTLQRLLLLASQTLRAEGLATLQQNFLVPLPV